MKSSKLIPIGSSVEVDLQKINKNETRYLPSSLNDEAQFTVIDYKITDGGEIGYIVKSHNSKFWVFTSEFKQSTMEKFSINVIANNNDILPESVNLLRKSKGKETIKIYINGRNKIMYIINPINFIKWVIYTTKDIF